MKMEQKNIDQRTRDYAAIKDLCKGSCMDKCPLVLKSCNMENCPLFFLTSLADCDIAAWLVYHPPKGRPIVVAKQALKHYLRSFECDDLPF